MGRRGALTGAAAAVAAAGVAAVAAARALRAGESQQVARAGESPGVVRPGESSAAARAGEPPGAARVGESPGAARVGESPGAARPGESSAAARAGASPGAARAGESSGAARVARPPGTAAYPPLGPRVVVGGISGSGKTTVARALARRRGVPHVELDAHFHLAGWREATPEQARATVAAATDGDAWVVDGNYPAVRDVVWPRATTLVWLDFPRGVGTWRALRRTVPRVVRRHELWNGNREEWRGILDPGHPIWWSWTHHPEHRGSYAAALADPAYAHLDVVRLRTPREADRWLRYAAGP